MPATGPSMGRYDSSVEGWSAVDKVAQFSHAVGRVSGGRGSAILIALMDSQGQLIDPRADPHSSRLGGGGGGGGGRHGSGNSTGGSGSPRGVSPTVASADTAGLRFNARNSHDSFRSASPGSVNSFERTSREEESLSRRGRDTHQPPLGVLLTTSHVLCTPEEAEHATVTFLDQLGLMTAASLGHDPKPVRVPLRGAYGFVTSAAEASEHSARYRRARERGSVHKDSSRSRSTSTLGRPQENYADEPDYLLYRHQDAEEEDAVDDIGFTLTFCDIFPLPGEMASGTPSQPPTPLRRSRPGVSGYGGGGESSSGLPSRGASPPTSSLRSSTQGRVLSSAGAFTFASRSDDGGGGHAAARSGSSEADTTPSAQTTTSRTAAAAAAAGGAGSSTSTTRNSLLLVQPLPVPLLLSAIPAVKVGDAHLMITHVNDGRRCYRVQHVAAVHPDYCEYKLANASEDECSGGPVFTSAGDFIGIQHERNGHSICLLMKSIVRNLFESDLLGMCRSPISETVLKKREPHTRLGGGSGGGAAAAAAASSIANGGDGSPNTAGMMTGSSGVYSPKASFKRSVLSPRTSSLPGTAATTPRTSTATNNGVASGSGAAAGAASAAASPIEAGLLNPARTAAPLSQQVPGYEAVFKEFYSGFDSLSHILYAFPYSRQLLKLALENLSQLKYGNELDQMSTIGGVGAILETIDGYPQDEAIVSGALAAMCRICIYERNLVMFLHLDGVTTTMEIMKEYVHQPTVLQWGTYLLVSATDASVTSAAQCAEMIVQSRGPQLFVNVLRVHGAVQRKSAVRHLQHNRLIRWTCDLIANLLGPHPQRTTLFLREDFLALLLQLLHDYAGNTFLTEGLVHVFCVFVHCFADLDPQGDVAATAAAAARASNAPPLLTNSPEQRKLPAATAVGYAPSFLSPADRLVHAQLSASGTVSPFARNGLASPYAAATDPHKVSFFFLCQVIASDTESCFLRALLDICEAAMDARGAMTAHRGRPEAVLLRCLTTLRLLLAWGLVHLHRRHHHHRSGVPAHGHVGSSAGATGSGRGAQAAPGAGDSFSSLTDDVPQSGPSATSSSLQMSTPSDELVRLRRVLTTVRATMPSSYELQAQLSAVEQLVQQQE